MAGAPPDRVRVLLAAAAALVVTACSSNSPATTHSDTTGTTSVDTVATSTPTPDSVAVTTAPTDATAAGDDAGGVQPEGFTTVEATITSADGEVCTVCLWLADDASLRSRGLMQVTDLGDPVGMVFTYEADTSGNFFMFNTPTPLSIAWFDRDGSYLAETDMEPCLVADSGECERYNPGAPYVFALEVPQGGLAALGVEPGSTFELVPGTESSLGLPCVSA